MPRPLLQSFESAEEHTGTTKINKKSRTHSTACVEACREELEALHKCVVTYLTSIACLGWPQNCHRLGLHRYRDEGVSGTQDGIFLVFCCTRDIHRGRHKVTGLSCCLWKGFWGGTGCFWSHSSTKCVCTCVFVQTCHILYVYNIAMHQKPLLHISGLPAQF